MDRTNLPVNYQSKLVSFDRQTGWLWFQEEISYVFIPADRVTEIRLVFATDNSVNIYTRIDMKDRLEYKLIGNKKTLAAAKKLAEDFVSTLKTAAPADRAAQRKPKETKEDDRESPKEDLEGIVNKSSGSLDALAVLIEELKD